MSEQFAFCTLIIVFLISSIHTLTAEVEDYVAYVSLSEVGYIGMVFVVGSEFISIAFFYSVVAFFPIVDDIHIICCVFHNSQSNQNESSTFA